MFDKKEIVDGIVDILLDAEKDIIDNKSIEEQFSYYSLKLVRYQDLYLKTDWPENDIDVDKQEKLIPVFKDFTEKLEKIMKGEKE